MNGTTPPEGGADQVCDIKDTAPGDTLRAAVDILDRRGLDPCDRDRVLRRLELMVEQGVDEVFVIDGARHLTGEGIADDGGIPADRPALADFDDLAPSVPEPEPNPDLYFDRHGLRFADLVDGVLSDGPIAAGPGESLWHWDGRGVWRPGGDNEVRRRCHRMLGQRSRRTHIEHVVGYFRALRPLIGDNPDTRFVNCRNGMLDWRTGTLHDHDPMIGSTWQLSVNWNPAATCPTVDAWLAQVAPDDAIDLLWQVIGAAIYAGLPVHRAILLFGPGRNGKGTFLRLVEALVGSEHCASVPLQSLGENRFAAAELYGKAVNLAGDLDARAIIRTDVFKMVTGGDTVLAERKYGQPFHFVNRALMIFAANELPGTADHTDGFHSRWIVVPFTKLRLAADDIDPDLEPTMHTELEGVFVNAVNGLRSLIDQGGFDTPPSVIDATTGYRDTSDPIRRFVDEHVTITGSPDDRVTRSKMYDSYKAWCIDETHRPVAASKFWGRVRTIDSRIDVDGTKIQGNRYVIGVELDDEVVVL